jgi:hypothetical protein
MEQRRKLFLVAAFLVLAITLAFYLIFPTLTGFTSMDANEGDNVKLATFAVCEQKDNYTLCKDKLFASCNHEVIEVNDSIFYCNGKKYNASNLPLGETYHIQNWTDPRQNNFITGWAASE